jgi:hypothetical protein
MRTHLGVQATRHHSWADYAAAELDTTIPESYEEILAQLMEFSVPKGIGLYIRPGPVLSVRNSAVRRRSPERRLMQILITGISLMRPSAHRHDR